MSGGEEAPGCERRRRVPRPVEDERVHRARRQPQPRDDDRVVREERIAGGRPWQHRQQTAAVHVLAADLAAINGPRRVASDDQPRQPERQLEHDRESRERAADLREAHHVQRRRGIQRVLLLSSTPPDTLGGRGLTGRRSAGLALLEAQEKTRRGVISTMTSPRPSAASSGYRGYLAWRRSRARRNPGPLPITSAVSHRGSRRAGAAASEFGHYVELAVRVDYQLPFKRCDGPGAACACANASASPRIERTVSRRRGDLITLSIPSL